MYFRSLQEAWTVFAGDICQYSAAKQYQDHQQACMESFQRFLGQEGPRHPAKPPLLPAVLLGAPVRAPFCGSLTQQSLEFTAGAQSSVMASLQLARPQPSLAPVPLAGLYIKVSTSFCPSMEALWTSAFLTQRCPWRQEQSASGGLKPEPKAALCLWRGRTSSVFTGRPNHHLQAHILCTMAMFNLLPTVISNIQVGRERLAMA